MRERERETDTLLCELHDLGMFITCTNACSQNSFSKFIQILAPHRAGKSRSRCLQSNYSTAQNIRVDCQGSFASFVPNVS